MGLGLVASGIAFSGCDDNATLASDAGALDAHDEAVSYHKDIRPLMESHCLSCHAHDGTAPIPLHDWTNAEQWRVQITHMVGSHQMPPAQTNPSCSRMVVQHWLEQEDRQIFEQWASDGYLEGNPEDYEPPPSQGDESPWRHGEPDAIAKLPEPFDLPEGTTEVQLTKESEFRFQEDTNLVAVRVVPEHPRMLHHLTVFLSDGEGNVLRQEDPIHPTAPGVIGGYAPGNAGFSLPEGAAFFAPKGSGLLIEAHYLLSADDAPTSGEPVIELWFMPEDIEPSKRATVMAPGLTGFMVPAEDPHVVISGEVPMGDVPMEIIAVSPHMHYFGIAGHMEILRPESEETSCVIDTPNYTFEWQILHQMLPEARVHVQPGDIARLTCVYDNSAENQPYVDGEQITPTDVHYGPSSLDEMCTMVTVVLHEP